jgi:hypothetical protein
MKGAALEQYEISLSAGTGGLLFTLLAFIAEVITYEFFFGKIDFNPLFVFALLTINFLVGFCTIYKFFRKYNRE